MAYVPKVVLFLGAGASYALGIPLMNGFLDRVRERHLSSPEEHQLLDSILRECGQLSTMIGDSARNLESIMSLLSMLELMRPEMVFDERGTTASEARRFFSELIVRTTTPTMQAHRIGRLANAIAADAYELSIITTNYDLHPECAALYNGKALELTKSVQCDIVPGPNCPYSPNSRVKMFKLHGSVNWTDRDGGLAATGEFVRNPHPSAPNQTVSYDVRLDSSESAHIIAPSIQKEYANHAIREQWQGAARAMAGADRIAFCGYSFPETDSFMRYAIAVALHRNTSLRDLVIVDPSSASAERGGRLFSSATLRSVLSHYPWSFEEFDLTGWLATGAVSGAPGVGPSGMSTDQMLRTLLHNELINRGLHR